MIEMSAGLACLESLRSASLLTQVHLEEVKAALASSTQPKEEVTTWLTELQGLVGALVKHNEARGVQDSHSGDGSEAPRPHKRPKVPTKCP